MDLTSRYQVCERDVAEKDISGSRLLVPTTGVSGIFELNEMSSLIWQEIKQYDRLDLACNALIQKVESADDTGESSDEPTDAEDHVPYSREAFTQDVLAIAQKLSEIGAIKFEEAESVNS